MLLNANSGRGIDIYILSGKRLSAENERSLLYLLRHHPDASMHFVLVDESLFDGVPRFDRFTLAASYRLLISKILPHIDRCIYLDSDIAVLGDIAELFDHDLTLSDGSISPIGANQDVFGERHKSDAGMGHYHDFIYCNSGVLLMNLKRIRELALDDKFIACGIEEGDRVGLLVDQNILNVVMQRESQFKYISCAWNCYGKEALERDEADFALALQNPKIIHFISGGKPWVSRNKQPNRDYYWRYIPYTNFSSARLKYLAEYLADSIVAIDRSKRHKTSFRILRIPLFRRITLDGQTKYYMLGMRIW